VSECLWGRRVVDVAQVSFPTRPLFALPLWCASRKREHEDTREQLEDFINPYAVIGIGRHQRPRLPGSRRHLTSPPRSEWGSVDRHFHYYRTFKIKQV